MAIDCEVRFPMEAAIWSMEAASFFCTAAFRLSCAVRICWCRGCSEVAALVRIVVACCCCVADRESMVVRKLTRSLAMVAGSGGEGWFWAKSTAPERAPSKTNLKTEFLLLTGLPPLDRAISGLGLDTHTVESFSKFGHKPAFGNECRRPRSEA